ncbi:helicase-related protein, partial [bacterium]|nr:helicase-related protein [bacterium]
TLFGLYESIIDELCTFDSGFAVKPKIVCSTATIRGARDQIKSVFARDEFTLFPPPGIDISDSFFGKYATDKTTEELLPGRMYVGVNAPDFVSSQTTQVRVFSSLLMNAQTYIDKDRRDPWWTNLIFFNSLRELGGSATLFQGDVKARLKFLKYRDSVDFRKDPLVVELSSRLKQDEIIDMLDRLANVYPQQKGRDRTLDACLASNIIEVGVDIDRLSLMCVVGQPKNTAQYIQVTGRVGRRWQDRPGLVFTLYSPTKIRDKSHFEQFYSYHNRLYEQVEPTSATPFSRSSLERGVFGAMLVYARLTMPKTAKPRYVDYETGLDEARKLLIERCRTVEQDRPAQAAAAEQTIERIALEIKMRWRIERDQWDKIPLGPDDSVLLRWPGQFVKTAMKCESFEVPSSLRQVDGSGELMISKFYQTESDH